MAKQISCGITGRIDEYSFYQDRMHGYLVRRTGGVTAKQYRTEEKYAAARDASSEFALVSSAGKLIRNALAPFIDPVKDGTMVNRLNKELVALKQLDDKHSRGERRPETRMSDPDASKWLRIFQFNEGVKTYEMIQVMEAINRAPTAHLVKLQSSAFPDGATHAGLTMVRTVIDFEKKNFETDSSETVFVSNAGSGEPSVFMNEDLLLQDAMHHVPTATHRVPTVSGIEIICLQVLFFCEKDGKLIRLKRKVHSMGIIAVNCCDAKAKTGGVKRRYFYKKIDFQPSVRYLSRKRQGDQERALLKNDPT